MQASELAWNIYQELRKEIIATQQLRSTIVGLKITIVSAAIGYIIANTERSEWVLLVVPAFAAIFFDFLINASSLAINRKGSYCAAILEPKLRAATQDWPGDHLLWEEQIGCMPRRQLLPLFANAGMTVLAAAPAVLVLTQPGTDAVARSLLLLLALGIVAVVFTHYKVGLAAYRREARQEIASAASATPSATEAIDPRNR